MATDIIARGMITEYKSGTNINFAENDDGSVTISASGGVSSEDSVARDTINNHKLDKNNPHNVTAEQIGLGNVDNTSDLDKPISTAVQQAIDNKADKTVATTSADGLMSAEDKGKLDNADNAYALKSKYGDTTINVGRKAGTTVGSYSTAEGSNTTASGICSHAENGETTASGDFSHAEGLKTTAAQSYTHTEGYNTSSNAPAAHAEGYSSIAAGQASHAEGQGTQAVGNNSHSGGYGASSFNNSSFSHGIYTIANKDGEIAFGKYNESNDDTVFSVGDGTSDDARHNAFEITTTGGKMHDKDIATTDLIPTSLPANGGNADTVNSLKTDAPNYLDIFSTTLSPSHPCWNKKCSIYGQSNDINAELYLANAPEINIAVWYEVETIGNSGRAYQIAHGCYSHQRKSFIRYMHDAVWSDWKNIADGGDSDYATNAGNAEKLGGLDASAYSTSIIKSVTFSAATTNGYIWTGIPFPKYVIGVDLEHFDVIVQFYKGNHVDAGRAEWAMMLFSRNDVTTPLNGSFNGVIYYID